RGLGQQVGVEITLAFQSRQLFDHDGIAKAILYPTISLRWIELQDPEISAAYCRAYNRWIIDFCADTVGRLISIAQVSLEDPNKVARRLPTSVIGLVA